eukprot:scaffold34932_cov114-Amphora_coffeaeformis.AAC.2
MTRTRDSIGIVAVVVAVVAVRHASSFSFSFFFNFFFVQRRAEQLKACPLRRRVSSTEQPQFVMHFTLSFRTTTTTTTNTHYCCCS